MENIFITKLRKHWYAFSIITVILIAALIRGLQLGKIPHGMTWDEAAIGYNGYSVITTRRDEWLNFLPISFKSFGDFKAPLAIYVTGLFTYFLGINVLAVRLPFFIASLFSILGIIKLTAQLFKNHPLQQYYSVFAGFILALSPWHIHYSRAGFESGIALTFLIWAILYLEKTIENTFKNKKETLISVTLFVAAVYTYHSSKIVIPLIGLLYLSNHKKNILKNIKKIYIPFGVFIIGLLPFIADSILGEGLTRAGVTIFSSKISLLEKCMYIIKGMLIHFSPGYLILGETTTLRHSTGYLGVLFPTTAFLFFVGMVSVFFNKKLKNKVTLRKAILLMMIGILPAAVAFEVPHSNRALLALPGFIITAIFGLDYIVEAFKNTKIDTSVLGTHGEKNIIAKAIIGTLLAGQVLFSVSFLHYYFTEFSKTSVDAFNDGYLEAFEIVKKYEMGIEGYPEAEKIVFSTEYGQPYIYALFSKHISPIEYNNGALIKYEFYPEITVADLDRPNAVIVGAATDELPTQRAKYLVYGSDGKIRFQIFYTGETAQ